MSNNSTRNYMMNQTLHHDQAFVDTYILQKAIGNMGFKPNRKCRRALKSKNRR